MTALGRRKRGKSETEALSAEVESVESAESEAEVDGDTEIDLAPETAESETAEAETAELEAAEADEARARVARAKAKAELATAEAQLAKARAEAELADAEADLATAVRTKVRKAPKPPVPQKAARAEQEPERASIGTGTFAAITLLALLAVALLGAAGTLWWHQRGVDAKEKAALQAATAAAGAAQDFSSADYRTLDASFKAAAGDATGALKDQYLSLAASVRSSYQQQQTVVQGTVLKTGVVQVTSADQVTVLVFVNQAVQKVVNGTSQTSTDQQRIQMVMNRIQGRWLASKVDVL
ncbi:MAG TPA: hypothetical protein VNW94_13005 [Streptosporangiaceae bacterium]|nr:hypothetical protein [Streptosporangiaceae bacterium]